MQLEITGAVRGPGFLSAAVCLRGCGALAFQLWLFGRAELWRLAGIFANCLSPPGACAKSPGIQAGDDADLLESVAELFLSNAKKLSVSELSRMHICLKIRAQQDEL